MIKIENIIELKNVSYQKPLSKYILKNININIKKGEFIAIMGANGCGKSTLMKMLLKEMIKLFWKRLTK